METRGDGNSRERRANIRLHRVLAIELDCNDGFRSTVAVDLSISGFQVAANFSPSIGQLVATKLYIRNGPEIEATAKLIWSEALDLGLYRLGLQFEELRSVADFERLCCYIEKERLNSDGVCSNIEETLELASQVTLRNITAAEIHRFSVLARISELLNSCHRLDEVLERAMKITVEATGAERGMVLLDRGGREFEVPAFHAMTDTTCHEYSRSVVNQVLETGEPLLSLDAQFDERLNRSSSLKAMGTRSVLCLTIGSGDRRFGMIYLDSSIRSGAFTQMDLKLATVIAGLAASAIERAENFTHLARSEKLASMGTLTAGIMHELTNPLSSILGISELLAEDAPGPLTQDLLEEARRCQKLVKDLLRLSRKEPPQFTPVDLVDVVESASTAVRYELQKNDVVLRVETQSPLAPVMGNADHLRQVVLNLLSNAVHAAGKVPGGLVEVRLRGRERTVTLSVCDNGAGLPSDGASSIFDPFYTTKSADRGTGLGLSIVHRIVSEHQGTVVAENRCGGGALFTVTLPCHSVEEPPQASVS